MPKKASKKRKLPVETEMRDADASRTRQNNNPSPEIHEEHRNDRHENTDEEMRDDEPDRPELLGNTDGATISDCIDQRHEAKMERTKKSYDLMVVLCRRVDALVDKTLGECGGNQAVSRVVADLQACMKASIVTHLSPSAQAADSSLNSPLDNQPTTSQTPPEQVKTPATKEPPQSLRRKPIQKATYSPPEKHAAPKTYAELLRGATPANLPKRPAQPPPNKRPSKTNRVFVRLLEDSALRVRTPALHHQDGKQRFAERERGGNGLLCPYRGSSNPQDWNYNGRPATVQRKDRKGPRRWKDRGRREMGDSQST